MFRTDLLSIIRSFNVVLTAIGICHASYVDCLLARSGWNCCEYSKNARDDGQSDCLKHVELFTKIKFRNGASCWLLS